jgi:hypothetical protein
MASMHEVLGPLGLSDSGKTKSFITLTPGPNVTKLFTSVIYEILLEVKAFVPGKPFQPSLMFVGKARSLP